MSILDEENIFIPQIYLVASFHYRRFICLSYLYMPYEKHMCQVNYPNKSKRESISVFLSIWIFFHEYLRFIGQQGKGEAISLAPLYYFHSLHRHLDINRLITAENPPLHIASSWNRAGNL